MPASRVGKSSRQCEPRVSVRRAAAATSAVATVSRLVASQDSVPGSPLRWADSLPQRGRGPGQARRRPGSPRRRPTSRPAAAGGCRRPATPRRRGRRCRARAAGRPARSSGQHVRGDPPAEDQPLQQRVGRQPVGAVHAGAGRLAAGVQARHRGPSVQVGGDPAGGVVRGRRDRDQLRVTGSMPARSGWPGWSGTGPATSRRRSAGRPARRARRPVSRIRRRIALATTSRGARSASSCWPCMNRLPSSIDQERALAADRLADQRLLAGRRRRPARARSGGTGRTPGRGPPRRPAAPRPPRPRWRPAGWWWPRRPGRCRRWPARSPGPGPRRPRPAGPRPSRAG